MRAVAHDADLVVQGWNDVFVWLNAERRAFVDLTQSGGDGRGAQGSLATGDQGEDGRTAAQDGFIRLQLTGECKGALFTVLLGDEVKRIAVISQDEAALPLGVGEVVERIR